MQLNRNSNHVETYQITLDASEGLSEEPVSASFVLDHKEWWLTATVNTETYGCCWGPQTSGSFLSFLSHINPDELLDRISKKTVFDLEESKKETIEALERNGLWTPVLERDIMEYNTESEDNFRGFVTTHVPDLKSVPLVKDYPEGAKTAIYLFGRYIQPDLRSAYIRQRHQCLYDSLSVREIDYIFERKQLEYFVEDAMQQFDEWCSDNEGVELQRELDEHDFEELALKFSKSHDCNVDDNTQWQILIREYLTGYNIIHPDANNL